MISWWGVNGKLQVRDDQLFLTKNEQRGMTNWSMFVRVISMHQSGTLYSTVCNWFFFFFFWAIILYVFPSIVKVFFLENIVSILKMSKETKNRKWVWGGRINDTCVRRSTIFTSHENCGRYLLYKIYVHTSFHLSFCVYRYCKKLKKWSSWTLL